MTCNETNPDQNLLDPDFRELVINTSKWVSTRPSKYPKSEGHFGFLRIEAYFQNQKHRWQKRARD